MTDLPDPSQQPAQSSPQATDVTATPTGNKEMVGGVELPESAQHAGSAEVGLPKEVVSAGVRIQPTSIPIPAPLAQMGVAAAGKNVLPPQAVTAALPLTDDKIAEGLRQTITSSWLWLAHWCLKKLKQFHIGIQSMHGKTIRVKI